MSVSAKSAAEVVEVGPFSIHVQDTREGRSVLLLLHYWGGSTRTWRPVIERLAPEFRCIAYDQRGWGQSGAPATDFAITDMADDALAVIAELQLDNYVLVGHSMGGKVAQELASRRPTGLRGLALIAPSPADPTVMPAESLAAMKTAYLNRESVLGALAGVLSHLPLDEQTREQIVSDSLAGAPSARDAWPNEGIAEDVSAHLSEINVPVIVVAGENDMIEPVEVLMTRVVDRIPGAELVLIPGAGHLSPLEAAGEVADHVRDFARRVLG